jgi:hypothetical protein
MAMAKRGVKDAYFGEANSVEEKAKAVANIKDGWTRNSNLKTTQAQQVSNIYEELTKIIAQYGEFAKKDAKEFIKFGEQIVREDEEDAK